MPKSGYQAVDIAIAEAEPEAADARAPGQLPADLGLPGPFVATQAGCGSIVGGQGGYSGRRRVATAHQSGVDAAAGARLPLTCGVPPQANCLALRVGGERQGVGVRPVEGSGWTGEGWGRGGGEAREGRRSRLASLPPRDR